LFVEVKGRVEGADAFVVTQNELRFAANVPAAYVSHLSKSRRTEPNTTTFVTCAAVWT